jgi:hypothetical protein
MFSMVILLAPDASKSRELDELNPLTEAREAPETLTPRSSGMPMATRAVTWKNEMRGLILTLNVLPDLLMST